MARVLLYTMHSLLTIAIRTRSRTVVTINLVNVADKLYGYGPPNVVAILRMPIFHIMYNTHVQVQTPNLHNK